MRFNINYLLACLIFSLLHGTTQFTPNAFSSEAKLPSIAQIDKSKKPLEPLNPRTDCGLASLRTFFNTLQPHQTFFSEAKLKCEQHPIIKPLTSDTFCEPESDSSQPSIQKTYSRLQTVLSSLRKKVPVQTDPHRAENSGEKLKSICVLREAWNAFSSTLSVSMPLEEFKRIRSRMYQFKTLFQKQKEANVCQTLVPTLEEIISQFDPFGENASPETLLVKILANFVSPDSAPNNNKKFNEISASEIGPNDVRNSVLMTDFFNSPQLQSKINLNTFSEKGLERVSNGYLDLLTHQRMNESYSVDQRLRDAKKTLELTSHNESDTSILDLLKNGLPIENIKETVNARMKDELANLSKQKSDDNFSEKEARLKRKHGAENYYLKLLQKHYNDVSQETDNGPLIEVLAAVHKLRILV